jgi:superfamily II DNA/RNA helicase
LYSVDGASLNPAATPWQPPTPQLANEVVELPPEILIEDEASDLYCKASFEDLKYGMGSEFDQLSAEVRTRLDLIRRAALEMDYKKMFPIQASAIPYILKGFHVLGQAPGGGGKTAAFTIGMLAHIDVSNPHTQGLIVGMTRELAGQIYEDAVVPLSKNMAGLRHNLFLAGIHPGEPSCDDHVIVGTPGKLGELIERGYIRLDRLRVFVIDEADELIMDSNNAKFENSMKNWRRRAPRDCLTLLFSATFPKGVKDSAKEFLTKGRPIQMLTIPTTSLIVKNRSLFSMAVTPAKSKLAILQDVYDYCAPAGKSVVFCNTIKATEDVYGKMQELGKPCSVLHGDLKGEERDRALKVFRGKLQMPGVVESNVLICTDALARGVDISNVTLVVNYELPVKRVGRGGGVQKADTATFLHRVARCGRAGRRGLAISLVGNAADADLIETYKSEILDGQPETQPIIQTWPADDFEGLVERFKAASAKGGAGGGGGK